MREKVLVTGGSGFIGSNLTDRLLENYDVVVYDNFSTGFESFLSTAKSKPGYSVVRGDILDAESLTKAMKGCSLVFHLAANADVRFGADHPERDLEQNTVGTSRVLQAMRANDVGKIVFSSTGSIYGDTKVIPTPEDAPFPIQTSLYGASKLAGESLIQAYAEAYGIKGYIFRFVSILGERYTHGHVFDFYKNLLKDPSTLRVLGNGRQRKSYLYVQDCIDAIFCALEKSDAPVNIFNLGTDEYCEVNDSIGWIVEHLGLSPKLDYTGGERGWIGDNAFIFLDTKKIRSLGWKPKLTIRDGVIKTISYLQANQELLVRS